MRKTILSLCLLAGWLLMSQPFDAVPAAVAILDSQMTAAFFPEGIDFGGETVYLLNSSGRKIERWSVSQRRSMEPILLKEAASHIRYSPAHDRLYVAYPGGKIRWFGAPLPLVENHFVDAPAPPAGLVAAGDHLLVFLSYINSSIPRQINYTFAGSVADSSTFGQQSPEYIWSPSKRLVYFTNLGSALFWEEIDAEGKIKWSVTDGYAAIYGQLHPIRVFPDGESILMGNGEIYTWNGVLKQEKSQIISADAVWHDGVLFTLPEPREMRLLQKWTDDQKLVKQVQTNGLPLRLFSTSHGLLVVSISDGQCIFTVWDGELNVLYQSIHKLFLPYVSMQ
jgi:hypothetical protein